MSSKLHQSSITDGRTRLCTGRVRAFCATLCAVSALLCLAPATLVAQSRKDLERLRERESLRPRHERIEATNDRFSGFELQDEQASTDKKEKKNKAKTRAKDETAMMSGAYGADYGDSLRLSAQELADTPRPSSAAAQAPDSLWAQWLREQPLFEELPYNPILGDWIWYYAQRRIKSTQYGLRRLSPYEAQYRAVFRHMGIPEEAVYLCLVESGANPKAVSPAGAAGVWQLMPDTAEAYGLRADPYLDLRFDPLKSAAVAARLLRDLHTSLGSWAFAISAYNCGRGNVERAIKKAGSRDFWKAYPFLPEETRNYLPALVATMRLTDELTKEQ